MQVEYKTEKGTVLFVKVPEDVYGFWFNNQMQTLHFTDKETGVSSDFIDVNAVDFELIGLTNEITEKRLKDMFSPKIGILYEMFGYNYLTSDVRNTFKSLMQYLKVYEVNPYTQPITKSYDFFTTSQRINLSNYREAQQRTGKWIVLFKPNT